MSDRQDGTISIIYHRGSYGMSLGDDNFSMFKLS